MLWQNRQQRTQARHLAWVISLLLFLSPIITQAHWIAPIASSGATDQQMPCHQASNDVEDCKHCTDAVKSLACDCCDSAVPLNLGAVQGLFFTFQFHAERPIQPDNQEFPDPLLGSLYRPPIQHLI